MRNAARLVMTLALALLPPAVWGAAEEPQAAKADATDKAKSELKVPETPEEHLARAAAYDKKAAAYREEAAMHRKMFADHEKKKGSPNLQNKVGREFPWITKMRKHCDEYIVEAEKMAAEAERFAEFHRMRAAEMKGM